MSSIESSHPSPDNEYSRQMAEAMRNQRAHVTTSMHVDRRGWTRRQWVEDARNLMGDLDGSVLALVNGHVTALLAEIDHLNGKPTYGWPENET